jgi:hypothetical protein
MEWHAAAVIGSHVKARVKTQYDLAADTSRWGATLS